MDTCHWVYLDNPEWSHLVILYLIMDLKPLFQIRSYSVSGLTYLLGATIQPSTRCPLKCQGSIWAGVATNTLWTFLQMPKSHSQTCEVPRWVPVRLAHSGGGTVGPGTALFDVSFPRSVFSCLFFFLIVLAHFPLYEYIEVVWILSWLSVLAVWLRANDLNSLSLNGLIRKMRIIIVLPS